MPLRVVSLRAVQLMRCAVAGTCDGNPVPALRWEIHQLKTLRGAYEIQSNCEKVTVAIARVVSVISL
ncbi:hypothetical protein GCM10023354_01810 [Garicola koreensis]